MGASTIGPVGWSRSSAKTRRQFPPKLVQNFREFAATAHVGYELDNCNACDELAIIRGTAMPHFSQSHHRFHLNVDAGSRRDGPWKAQAQSRWGLVDDRSLARRRTAIANDADGELFACGNPRLAPLA